MIRTTFSEIAQKQAKIIKDGILFYFLIQAITLTLGFWDLRYCPTPETVPPLPIPITKMSTFP